MKNSGKRFGLLGACSVLLSISSYCIASGGGAHWSYSGATGPDNWGNLSSDYGLCQQGQNQSPINISDATKSGLFQLDFNYRMAPLQIVNNGHTIQVNMGETRHSEDSSVKIGEKTYALPGATHYNSSLSISGETYRLLQFHFHDPSEHKIAGKSYPMEAHLVHINDQGQLAVVGVILKSGAHNNFIDQLWQYMPANAGKPQDISQVSVDINQLLPAKRTYSHYRGSLTTPPCSEGVRWFVMNNAVELSAAQINKFASVVGQNARPVQAIKQRFLLGTR